MEAYLDHNATAPCLPAAARAAADWLLGPPGNPSSAHAAGRRARAAIEQARGQVAAALGARPGEVVFTSGATEALHLAVAGLVPPGGHVVASAVEHPALFGACRVAGAEVTRVPVDALGRLDPAAFRAALRPETALVAVMAAQNEIGNLYPVRAVAEAVGPVPVLSDAAQAFGKVALEPGPALVVVSGHKVGAPAGVGALWVAPGLDLAPFVAGGPQERGRRGGTENTAGIVAFGVAATALPERLASMPRVEALRDGLEAALRARVPGLRVHGDPAARLPNTLSFRCVGVDGDLLLAALDLEGVRLSSGSACSSGSLAPSSVLRALGLDDDAARAGVRVSLGPETTEAEVERLIDLLPAIVARAHLSGAA